ncbi:MAG TPA: tetratricopeptide repeat protein [Vicinamibacterales bacterium]|nr:tetratricopeptide repeat protein [Vicinamibacterales bacterium]
MKSDSIAFGIAGIAFGLIAGWIIGSQQAPSRQPPAQATTSQAPAPANTRAAVIDDAKVTALKSVAEREPSNAKPRIDLGNLYFDAERYDDAISWYEAALKLTPRDVNLSTDLGVCYYYTNQPDKALAQFDKSLAIDPKHAKTLLNLGIVRAFGKQDLAGATKAWEQVMAIDPNSPEGQAAKRALDTLRSAHGGDTKPGA